MSDEHATLEDALECVADVVAEDFRDALGARLADNEDIGDLFLGGLMVGLMLDPDIGFRGLVLGTIRDRLGVTAGKSARWYADHLREAAPRS